MPSWDVHGDCATEGLERESWANAKGRSLGTLNFFLKRPFGRFWSGKLQAGFYVFRSPVNLGSCVLYIMDESAFSFVLLLHFHVIPWGIGWETSWKEESPMGRSLTSISALLEFRTPPNRGTTSWAFFYEDMDREVWAKFKKWSVMGRYLCYVKQKTKQGAKQHVWYNMYEKLKGYVYKSLNYVYLYIWYLHIYQRCLRIEKNLINILRNDSEVCERKLLPFP